MRHLPAGLVLLLIACTACTTSSGVSPTATSTRAPGGLTAVSARAATQRTGLRNDILKEEK